MKYFIILVCSLFLITGYIKAVSGSGEILPLLVSVDDNITEFEYTIKLSSEEINYIQIDNPFESDFLVVVSLMIDNTPQYLYNSEDHPIEENVVHWFYDTTEYKLYIRTSNISTISDSASLSFYSSVPHMVSEENYFDGLIKTPMGSSSTLTGISPVTVANGQPVYLFIETTKVIFIHFTKINHIKS